MQVKKYDLPLLQDIFKIFPEELEKAEKAIKHMQVNFFKN